MTQASTGELSVLLLKAAIGDGDQARSAWASVKQRIGAMSELEGETYRLLPLLYRNLSERGVDDPGLQQLKGVYRHSWYANHLLFHEAGALLALLEQAGVDTLVLKGGALTQLYYDDAGTRPMEDLDVLVRGRKVRKAIEVLEHGGWTLNAPYAAAQPLEGILRTRHSVEYQHPGGQKLDLHWSPFFQPVDEQPFWDDAIPLEIGGTQTRALCPEDQLLHLCVHGVDWNIRQPYWAADAVLVMRSRQGNLDWQRLVEQARANQLSLALEYGLRFLRDDFELDIPSAVLEQLSAMPRSRSERLAHRMALAQPRHGVGWVHSWDRYRRLAAREGWRASLAGFLTYTAQAWGLAKRRHLLGRMLKKGGQIVRYGVSHPTGAGEAPRELRRR